MAETVDFGVQLFKLVMSLVFVLGVLFAGAWALKRWGGRLAGLAGGSAESQIRVHARHSFDPKHHVFIIQSREETFLIGISPQGIQLLSQLEDVPAGPVESFSSEVEST